MSLTENPVVIVSGAAGGIGRATVASFSKAGFPVVGLDIDPVVEELSALGTGGAVVGLVADHERLDELKTAMARAAKIGQISHVVTFAGVALPEEIAHDDDRGLLDPALFRATIERNLLGHVNLLWCAQEYLFKSVRERSVTLCSSVNALQGWGEPGYSTAKAGLIGLVRSLAGPYGRRGIRINAIAPGTIDSKGARMEYADVPERFELMQRTVPLGSLGQVDDVAAVALALARDLRHVHGTVITVDGGQTIDRSASG